MAEVIVLLDHMEIGSSEVGAGLAFTPLLQRREVLCESLVSELYLAVGSEGCSESRSSCWEDAVKHVDSKCYAERQVNWISDSHQVSWFVCRKSFAALSHSPEEILLCLAAR